ncbi:MAG: M28 family peptidase [Planctomycetia bacterium]|nr:M28 family peptidase [Planctomycetia bacterium]
MSRFHPALCMFLLAWACSCVVAQEVTQERPDVHEAAQRMRQTVRFLSEDCFPRDARSEKQNEVMDFLESQFLAAGFRVTRQRYVLDDGEVCFNICALKEGRSRERILIGAHYDTVPETPGADDNGSGVAVILELARLLKDAQELSCDVELVSWDTEEPPFFATDEMGSFVHAQDIARRGVRLRAVLCLDVVGYYSSRPGSQEYPVAGMEWIYGSKGDFLAIIGRLNSAHAMGILKRAIESDALPVRALPLTESLATETDFSDHRNYLDFQCPVLFLTNTAFYRTPHYHEPTDTWEKLDYTKMAHIALGLRAAIEILPENPAP